MRCIVTFLASANRLLEDKGTPRIQTPSSARFLCAHFSAQQEPTGGTFSGSECEQSRRAIRDLNYASYLKNSFKLHLRT